MGPETRLQIRQFLETAAVAPARLLMLDFDGTLAPLRENREQVYPYPKVLTILQEIIGDGRTRVVMVSGRDVNDLIQRLGIQPVPELWGLHGMQRRTPAGTVETAPVEKRYMDALSDADRWLEYQQLRNIAEFKGVSIAAHWRGFSKTRTKEIRARVLLGWEPIANGKGLQMLEFDGGVEIRAPGPDKGDVVRILLGETKANTASAYLGDDSSDEPAFRRIRGRGLSVLVRPEWRKSAAQLWLRPPDEVVDFLTDWLAACRSRDSRGDATAKAGKA